MDHGQRVKLSKRLSYHLRHDPRSAGIELDTAGWASLEELLTALGADPSDIQALVVDGDKQRFELSPDGRCIRARYGHSVPVDPGHAAAEPPSVLFHGTAADRVERIAAEGIRRMGRRQVHLSETVDQARAVGRRHGSPVVLRVDAAAMHRDGANFACAGDGVWLVDTVAPGYLEPWSAEPT